MIWPIILMIASVFSFAILINAGLSAYVARQAAQRGYSFWHWFLACFLSYSIAFVVMLALMPDRSLERRRLEKKQILLGRLRLRKGQPLPQTTGGPLRNTSIGDMATMDPEKVGLMQSIGDQQTRMPLLFQSIGDQQTLMPQRETSIGDELTMMPQNEKPIGDESTQSQKLNQSVGDQETHLS